jgi:hypothetical protein
MIIGNNFNKQCKALLEAAAVCKERSGAQIIAVEEINRTVRLDRGELRNYLEYLADKHFIRLESIGGPLLYGHISLTNKGLSKVKSLRNSSGC